MPRRRITPSESYFVLQLPDISAPYIARYKLNGKDTLLAKVRCNRLIDIFMHVITYSNHTHFRTSVSDRSAIDEIYVALNDGGEKYVIPVQVKGDSDKLSVAQVQHVTARCRDSYPQLIPRPVMIQTYYDEKGEVIVLFKLIVINGQLRVADEKHYRLVPADSIVKSDLDSMADLSD